jgi:hypothetical protein
MASQEVTIRDTFSVGMWGKEESGTSSKSDKQPVPMLGALLKIQGTLSFIGNTLHKLVTLTQESLNIEKIKLTEEQLAQRDKSLASAETTPPITGTKDDGEKGPGILGKLKGMFTKQRGPKFWFAVVAAGLALLSRYSEELVEPLAKLLEFFDKHGLADGLKIIYKKIETWAIKEIEHYVDKIKEEFAKFKSDGEYGKRIDELLTSMGRVFVFLDDTIASIEKWYQGIIPEGVSFEDEYGRMHTRRADFGEKMDRIVDDLQPKIVELIADVFSKVWVGFRNTMLATAFIGLTGKIALNALSTYGFFAAPGSLASILAPTAVWSAGTIIPVAALATYAFVQTFRAFSGAFEKGVDDEGNFDFSNFIGAFFGGDEGGITNAFSNAVKVSGIGAGLGMTLAGLGMIAGLPAGPLGIIAGGLFGLMIGGLAGFVLGYIGGPAISKFFDDIGSIVMDTIQSIKDAFVGFFSRLKWGILGLFGIEEKTIAEKLEDTMRKRIAMEQKHGFFEGMETPEKGTGIHGAAKYRAFKDWERIKEEERALAMMVGDQGYGELTQSMLRDKDLVAAITEAKTMSTTDLLTKKDDLILQKTQLAENYQSGAKSAAGASTLKKNQKVLQTSIDAINLELEKRVAFDSYRNEEGIIPSNIVGNVQKKDIVTTDAGAAFAQPGMYNIGNVSKTNSDIAVSNEHYSLGWNEYNHLNSTAASLGNAKTKVSDPRPWVN